MSPAVMFAIVTMTPVVIGAVTLNWFLERRAKRRQQQEDIREAARKDRAAERERVKKAKRLARQDKIGDRIFWSLVEAWKRAGRPEDREVLRIRHNFGSADVGGYYIEISRNHPDPIYAKLWLSIDLNQPTGKEISVTGSSKFVGPDGHLWLPLSDGEGFIRNILAARVYGS